MTSKKILIITQGFFPDQSPRGFRATELVKEFCRQGHRVTLMSPDKIGISTLIDEYKFEFVSIGKLKWKIFNFNSLGIFGKAYNKAVNRLLPLIFEFPRIELFFKTKKALKKDKSKYDLLISIAVPYTIHWGVAAVWKTKSKDINTWIADCGDPYFLQENDTFRPPFYFKYVEKWFMNKPQFVSVPTPNSIKGYFPDFHHKIKVIPQGFRFEDVKIKEQINDGIIRFGYGGGFIQGRRDPRKFLEFLIRQPGSVRFEFHVYTRQSEFILPYQSKDPRIFIHKPVPRIELLEAFSSFDFVVNFTNIGTTQTPSKLIDYTIINKPILQVNCHDIDYDIVLEFLKANYINKFSVQDPDQYRIEEVTKKFLTLIHQ